MNIPCIFTSRTYTRTVSKYFNVNNLKELIDHIVGSRKPCSGVKIEVYVYYGPAHHIPSVSFKFCDQKEVSDVPFD